MWGGSWVPVFQQQDHVKAGERYWPVALHGSELLTIMLPPPLEHPQVRARAAPRTRLGSWSAKRGRGAGPGRILIRVRRQSGACVLS